MAAQGDRDSTCGLYAVVNAVKWLLGWREVRAQGLHDWLVGQMDAECCKKLLSGGVYKRELVKQLLGLAKEQHSFTANRLKRGKHFDNVNDLWRAMEAAWQAYGVLIIGYTHEDDGSHWTAVSAVSDRQMYLLNGEEQRIKKRACTVDQDFGDDISYRIEDVIILRRVTTLFVPS